MMKKIYKIYSKVPASMRKKEFPTGAPGMTFSAKDIAGRALFGAPDPAKKTKKTRRV